MSALTQTGPLDYQRFAKSLQKDSVASLYYLFGDETFLLEESLTSLVEKALGGALKDFNYDSFFASGIEADRIRDAIETLPMMGGRRVVVIKEAQDLKAKDLEVLLPIISRPVESSVVIFVATKVDMRLKFVKEFGKRGLLVKFDPISENQLPGWIRSLATRNKITLDDAAADLIQRWVGVDLININEEIRKLAQYIGEGSCATLSDVQEVVSKHRIVDVFALARAIGENRQEVALNCLSGLLDEGENPVGILSLVSRHIRILMMIKDGVKEGMSPSVLSSRVGVPTFFLREYMEQSRIWSENKLVKFHGVLVSTDRALKSSAISSRIWLENLVMESCR